MILMKGAPEIIHKFLDPNFAPKNYVETFEKFSKMGFWNEVGVGQ